MIRKLGRKFRRLQANFPHLLRSIAVPTADFAVLSPTGLQLAPALTSFLSKGANKSPAAIAFYGDEKIADAKQIIHYAFRPDWSPELLGQADYPGQVCLLRSDAASQFVPADFDFSPDAFAALWRRLAEANAPVGHIPRIIASRHLAVDYSTYSSYRSVRFSSGSPRPKVSIIIPTKDRLDLLVPCIQSIIELSSYPNYEILILDNNSNQAETFRFFEKIANGEIPRCSVIEAAFPFNWSRLNNLGAVRADGDFFVFLNNDTKIIAANWLEWLVEYGMRPNIGAVGGLLLRASGKIQSAGLIMGLGGWCDNYFGEALETDSTDFIPPSCIRNVTAVTGACLGVSRKTFEAIGGFDESFAVGGNDIEFCLRLLSAGYRNVYVPQARLYHLESQTRNPSVDPDKQRLRPFLKPYRYSGDPLFNENLSIFDTRGRRRGLWE